jgi:hypothetical protein
MALSPLEEIVSRLPVYMSVIAGVVTAFVAVIGAFRSGALRRVRVGNIELEGADRETLERIKTEIAGARVVPAPSPSDGEEGHAAAKSN